MTSEDLIHESELVKLYEQRIKQLEAENALLRSQCEVAYQVVAEWRQKLVLVEVLHGR